MRRSKPLIAMAGAVLAVVACAGLGATPGQAQPSPHSVPPAAPRPTASGNSPDAPDPHPPVGGLGPNGELVGGARLHSRGIVLPSGAKPLPANLTAAAWVLADLDSGDVLAARDPHGRYQPASILKTLTSVTLLPLLPGNRVVTVSQDAASAEGSAVGIVAGGRYSIDDLFTGLLLMSGNDTAAALAEAAGGVKHTVDLMNQTARSLGAYDTFVQTPSGLDGWQQLTSAYDMALFLRAAVNLPRFVAYDRRATALLPAQNVAGHKYGTVWLGNQGEPFLTTVPGALVSKIGFTDAAQHTYLCAASRGGRRLGVIFLRAQKYPIDQWQQAAELLDWGYALPRGTSVGHLETPAAPAAAPGSSATTSAASTARSAPSRTNAAAVATHHGGGSPPWGLIAVLIVVTGAGALWVSGRWLTGSHDTSGPTRA